MRAPALDVLHTENVLHVLTAFQTSHEYVVSPGLVEGHSEDSVPDFRSRNEYDDKNKVWTETDILCPFMLVFCI